MRELCVGVRMQVHACGAHTYPLSLTRSLSHTQHVGLDTRGRVMDTDMSHTDVGVGVGVGLGGRMGGGVGTGKPRGTHSEKYSI